jgi:hypothetical protein
MMKVEPINGYNLQVFQTLVDFVSNLHEFFGKHSKIPTKPLGLYYRLISKTSFKDTEHILRHIQCFKQFCTENREHLKTKQADFPFPSVRFTDNIRVDLKDILRVAEPEEADVIWEYILTIRPKNYYRA